MVGNIRELKNVVLRRAAESDLAFFHPSERGQDERTGKWLKESGGRGTEYHS